MTRNPRPKLFCIECGAKAQGSCACNAPYVPAHLAAAKAVAAHPEWSDRAIAKETGIPRASIQRARTGSNEPVEKRIGLDGKARRSPRHDEPTPAEAKHIPAARKLLERLVPIMNALMKEAKFDATALSPNRVSHLAHELHDQIFECSSPTAKAKACESCALEWKIDGTKPDKKIIDAVRGTAQAWSDLVGRLEAIDNHPAETEACLAPMAAFASQRGEPC